MASYADAFDSMMDTGEWARVGAVFGGTVTQAIGQQIVEPMVPDGPIL